MDEAVKKKILGLIQNTEDALQYAREAVEKGDADEVENQLDLASEYCADAFFTSVNPETTSNVRRARHEAGEGKGGD